MAKNKTQETEASVDDFLSKIESDEVRSDCLKLVEIIEKVSGTKAKMWGESIVGAGSYHYVYDSGREGDSFKAGFSPRKGKLAIYVMCGFDYVAEEMKSLGKSKNGKSCLYVKKLSDIDTDVLTKILKKSSDFLDEKYPPAD